MAGLSTARLISALHDSSLLPPEQCALLSELQEQCPGPRELARALVERGWLTPYQVEVLLMGDLDDLRVGPYVLLGLAGGGSTGQVFKARHQKNGHLVALKVIREDRQGDPRVLHRFRREIRALSRLSHPNIVTARDVSEIDRTRFFAMEFVEGVSLQAVIAESGALPLAPAIDYARQSALALQHAYEKGLIHRDVKPSNLLIVPVRAPGDEETRAGRWGLVKLLDLGFALLQQKPGERTESDCRLTIKGSVLGTVDYVAPEQVMSPREVDIRADLYSLGCSLYQMLTGQVPFPNCSPARKLVCHQEKEPVPIEELRPELPADVVTVVRKLMAKSPNSRFQTPAHLARTLTTILNNLDRESIDWSWQPPNLEGIAPVSLSMLPGTAERRWLQLALAAILLTAAGAGLVLLLQEWHLIPGTP